MAGIKDAVVGVLVALHALLVEIVMLFVNAKVEPPSKRIPASNPLLLKPASELAEMLRRREITSVELVTAYIERIKAVNPYLNAVVATRFEEALQEAAAADELLRSGKYDAKARPFLGVPCTVKENFCLTGMPNTAGLVARKALGASKRDAPAVAKMRAAGLIPLGVTNTSELCMWYESRNQVWGITRNPYDLSRIVGGSSGGEGAIIGAGASPLGIGSDIGGSIRMPAFFNGVFGHKPSPGLVDNAAQHPPAEGDSDRYCVTGPLCRYATDLYPALRVMARDPSVIRDPASYDLSKVRVMHTESLDVPLSTAVVPELRRALRQAADVLVSRVGMRDGKPLNLPEFAQAFDIWSAMIYTGQPHHFKYFMANESDGFRPLYEVFRKLTGQSPHTVPGLVLALIEDVPAKLAPQAQQEFVKTGKALAAKLHKLLGEDGVLLVPTHPTLALRHHEPVLRPFNFPYTALFNVMEVPVTAVPLGLGPDGLPLGIQVIAAPGNDGLCIRVAQELEREFGGWVEPALF